MAFSEMVLFAQLVTISTLMSSISSAIATTGRQLTQANG